MTLEIASILPSHQHEDPDFVLTIVHEEVVDLVEVVHHLQEYDQFLFAKTQSFHSIPGYFSCQNRLETRVCESRF